MKVIKYNKRWWAVGILQGCMYGKQAMNWILHGLDIVDVLEFISATLYFSTTSWNDYIILYFASVAIAFSIVLVSLLRRSND